MQSILRVSCFMSYHQRSLETNPVVYISSSFHLAHRLKIGKSWYTTKGFEAFKQKKEKHMVYN